MVINFMVIPSKIQDIIGKKYGKTSNIGLSDASICIYDDMVLKVQPDNAEADREHNMMRWLNGRIPVPKVIEYTKANKLSFLLMSKCSGKMACDNELMKHPEYQAELLAGALYELWQINWKDCPYKNTLDDKLKQAEYNVVNNLADIENCEPDTYSKDGFKDPEALLYWLQCNRPNEDLAISHGDFCLPNILLDDKGLTGLIDLGRCGVADKWCDIALCYRSIKDNYSGKYNRKWPGYSGQYLFDKLQIKPDWEKIRYYILLDELF